MQNTTTLETLLKRDRAIVVSGILGVSALAWAYTASLTWDMKDMGAGGMAMPQLQPWGGVDFSLTFVMWAVMMVAMMVPTAAPMILVFATINRKRRDQQGTFVPTGIFVLGYVVVWTGFAAAATLAQWGLHSASLLSPMMESTSAILGGVLLLGAGIFQWSPIKRACLSNCRTPMGFLMSEWREGADGALIMGLRHGVFCLGCCWVLMGLLFVLGIMNLLWIAALAGFVLVEKVAPGGQWVSRLSGLVLIGWGAVMIARVLG